MTRFARSFRSFKDKVRTARAANEWTRRMYAPETAPMDYSNYDLDHKRAAPARDENAPPLERDVLKAVWKLLAHHPKVAWVTRINSGTVMADFGADGVHPLRMNYKRGISDLIGQMKDGRFLACEVKREGAQL